MGGSTISLQEDVRIKQRTTANWREPFRILTTILLSLLLPLTFLLLARLSTARYLAAAAQLAPDHTNGLLSFLFIHNSYYISTILHALVSLITVAAFVHASTGLSLQASDHHRLRLYAAWIILCTLQVCVGLGIQGSIDAGINGSGIFMSSILWGERNDHHITGSISLLSRIMLLVGLHETTHFWSKSVVKAVVDDTVMGFVVKEERWIERVGMGLSLGALWWWKLRDEVDSLVVQTSIGNIGVAEFVDWWLYYLTVAIGSIRVLKGGIWVGMILLLRKVELADPNLPQRPVSQSTIDDKV